MSMNMNRINKACSLMYYLCEQISLGYDQSNRYDIRDNGECDCSSLVLYVLKESGYDIGDASYTGNMKEELTANGWGVEHNDGYPQKGYVLLNESHHTALYLGDGLIGQASIDENGNATGGESGDQTGRETLVKDYYNYPWDCYLVPPEYTGEIIEDEGEAIINMCECLFHCLDDHCGYPKDAIIYWSANSGFKWLPDTDCIVLIQMVNPSIEVVQSASNAPWLFRAYQCTAIDVRDTFGNMSE